MSKNIKQVFDANPITSNASTDLIYIGQSPYGINNDAAITYANFSAQFSSPFTAGAGTNSAKAGSGCTAAGNNSLSTGSSNSASGANSVCFGEFSTASGDDSFAMGFFAQAQKANTFAFGTANDSNPPDNTSGAWTMGIQNSATGSYSFALGCRSSSAFQGSWMLSDSTGAASVVNPAPTAINQYVSMFLGGHYFYNTNNSSTGLAVSIDANGNLINVKGSADQSFSFQTPSTGFSITIGSGVKTLILKPSGTLATGTITMPASPINGQEIRVSSSQIITALTVSANAGQSISAAPTTIAAAGNGFGYIYRESDTTWYRLY
jgi:hypothetical protein